MSTFCRRPAMALPPPDGLFAMRLHRGMRRMPTQPRHRTRAPWPTTPRTSRTTHRRTSRWSRCPGSPRRSPSSHSLSQEVFPVRLSFKHACSLAVLALSVAHSARAATNIDSCRAITEPGTYKLTKDLTVPAESPGTRTSCITIKGSNVTLDLNGHLIRGTNRSPNKGIEALGNGPIPGQGKNLPATGIRIANGIVADFNIGIDLLE